MSVYYFTIDETYSTENKPLNSGYRDRQECSSEPDLVEIHVGPATDLDHECFNHKKMYPDGFSVSVVHVGPRSKLHPNGNDILVPEQKKWKVIKVINSMLPPEKLLAYYNIDYYATAVLNQLDEQHYYAKVVSNQLDEQQLFSSFKVLFFFFKFLYQGSSKGGALKPINIDTLWVHVLCAWFRPEVAFLSGEKMEPAVGLLRIPPDSFFLNGQTHFFVMISYAEC
ncbi:putative [histone H3]-lysine(4) N-trimethyltransferase [Helianthus anomalus]